MFTGIIEDTVKVIRVLNDNSNRIFYLKGKIASDLKVDESVSHNGICLTVEEIKDDVYKVAAINETLKKTNAGLWVADDIVNVERSIRLNERLDGHIVQGHIDGTGICMNRVDMKGSVEFTFQYEEKFASLIIEKGSICVNGVSLTAFNVTDSSFTVAIIPYTFSQTNFNFLQQSDVVNLEFDILGKYVARIMRLNNTKSASN